MSAPTRCCGGPAIPCRCSTRTIGPGDNLYTNSLISWNPDTGKMNWYHQYVPGDMWDYDEAGSHILIDGEIAGQTAQARHPFAAQRLPLCVRARERADRAGEALYGDDHLDPRHRSEDRDFRSTTIRSATSRSIPAGRTRRSPDRTKKLCPSHGRRQQFLAGVLQPEDEADLHPVALDLQRGDA